jgi:autotransporter-associated beta strand protein
MKKYLLAILAIAGFTAALAPTAHSANLYWDSNGITAGAGATPNGTWGTDSFWNTSSGGTSGTFTTGMNASDNGFFSAGTDAVNPYTVTVNGTQASGDLTFQEGTPTLTGGTIALGATKTITASTTLNGTATIASAMTVDTTGTNTTLTFTANDGPAAATDLLIKGGISASGPNTYQLRFTGAGNTRIEGAISNHGAFIGSSSWTGTVTIAGNQTLGASTGITLNVANNKLVMGDTTSDVQSWGGTTTVSSSSALMTVKSSASAGPIALRGNGGTLDVIGTLNATNLTLGNATETGVLKLSGGNATFSGAGSTISIGIAGQKIIGGAAGYGTLTMNQTSAVNLTGNVTLGGSGTHENNFNLVKANTNTLTLSGENTFSGSTTITGGTLALGHNLALQNSALDTTGAGNVTFSVTTPTIGGLSGSVNLATKFTTGYSSVTALTLNPQTGVTANYSGAISNGAANMTLTKTGNGTQILSGANTYTGNTTVSAGTLLVNGSTSASSIVSVSAGATLGGNGTVGGATTILAGATHSPGNSPGLQTFGAGLTYSSNSSLTWELSSNSTASRGTNFDGINVTGGNLTIQAGVTSNLVFNGTGSSVLWSNSFWSSNQTWFVYDNANAPSLGSASIFDTVNVSLDSGGFSLSSVHSGASFSWSQSGNDLYLNYVIPEPSTWILLAGSLTAVVVVRRRRRMD